MAKSEETAKPGKVSLPGVRASFLFVFDMKPGKIDEATGNMGKPSHQGTFLFPKDTPEGIKLKKMIDKVIEDVKKAKWGATIPKLKPEKLCLRDGDLEDYDGYAGHWYISSSNPGPVVVVDRDRSELTKANGGPAKLFSGAFCNATLRIWAQDNEHGKRINASLEGIQYVRKGEPFGAKPIDPNEEFPDLSDMDDDLDSIAEDEIDEDAADLV